MLELLHRVPNGSWLKPLIALHEKGLDFRSRFVDVLFLEHYRPGFLRPGRETRLDLEGEGRILFRDGCQITKSR